jgi:hypothetical protein
MPAPSRQFGTPVGNPAEVLSVIGLRFKERLEMRVLDLEKQRSRGGWKNRLSNSFAFSTLQGAHSELP